MEKIYIRIGCKIVRAEPMSEKDWFISKGEPWTPSKTNREGYKVRYPDGYVSWSPKIVFGEAYREMTINEAGLVIQGLSYGSGHDG